MNTSIIPDSTYDQWAKELAELQQKYPELANEGVYVDAFKVFSESVTGFNLPLSDPWVISRGLHILNLIQKASRQNDISFVISITRVEY